MEDFKWILNLLGENKDSIDFDNINKFLDVSWLDDSFKKSLDVLIWNLDMEKLNQLKDRGLDWLNNATEKTVNDLWNKLNKIKNIGDRVDLDKISDKFTDLWNLWDNFLDN
jgi:hypothetical protein